MLRTICSLWATAVTLALWVPGAAAQETGQAVNQPNAPQAPLPLLLGRNTSAPETGGQELGEASMYAPALSGVQDFTPGSTQTTRSFLLPSVSVYQWADTNPFISPRPDGMTLSSILGNLVLQRNFGRSELTLDYAGGGTVANRQVSSPGGMGLNSIVQQLETTQVTRWRRFALLLSDQFSYFPESSFGSIQGGMTSLGPGTGGSLGAGLPDIRSFLTPDQSILTTRGGRVSNTLVTQGEYDLNPRSSVTVAGAYDSLRFIDSPLFGSYSGMFMTGYNHQISNTNTLGLIYRFSTLRFANLDRAISDHVAQLSYGRRITGRLAFQISAGPEVSLIRSGGVPPQTRVFWNLESTLRYRVSRTTLDLSYERGLTGGAGVLAGAEASRVEVTANKGLSRMWQGSFAMGYASNRNVDSTSFSASNQTFGTWYGRVQCSRPVGRSAEAFVGYLLQLQDSNAPICTGVVCGKSLARHQVFVGLNWHHRPFAMK
jgi:hypothetical protein